jgi:uncharacterized protein YbjQ (UPF0145 family)
MRAAIRRFLCALALCLPSLVHSAGESPVRVFDTGELTLDRYTVVERLWTGTWRAAFWIPAHRDAGSAIDALTSKAADLGADGVVNLHCVNDTGGIDRGYYCYGLAIKLK